MSSIVHQPAVRARFCDVSLPVPLDRSFTYELPETLRHRVQVGSRVIVGFGSRALTGVVVKLHDTPPEFDAKPVRSLAGETPAFDEHLLRLGAWVASYYAAPLGEVLRVMAPLGGEVSKRRTWALTATGVDVARQMTMGTASTEDATIEILRALERRPLAETTLVARFPKAKNVLRSLARKGFVVIEEDIAARKARKQPHEIEKAIAPDLARELNSSQQTALAAITDVLDKGVYGTILLHGVTGSGKTEVYLRAIDHALSAGKSALLLVPEIALTPQVAGQFAARFGSRAAILHSAFHDTERAAQWRRIQSGEVRVAIGTRSAVFAPLRDLGLILVDEEHDGSYKQEETPRYNGRDVAVVRARELNAVVVLGSATPSLESRYNAETGKYTLIEMPERVEGRPMPKVELIDMRVEFLETRRQATFSRRLTDAVRDRIAAGEQAMLLMNRRGFSSFVTCRACGERMMCVNCSVALTFHRRDRRLLCHYCNYSERVPDKCPKCESEHLYFAGSGSERVEDELHQAFPTARIARMDRDTVRGKHGHEEILRAFRAGEFDILVGTQMIAKGHDIPNVTLVGIVNADIGLGMPDFRAAERTFQLLTQASGRAGRGATPGHVLIQTIHPDHYAIEFAARQDYRLFYEKELQFRRAMRYPPFAALASVLVRAEKQEDAVRMSGTLANLVTPPPEGIKVLGPSEAPVPRLKREYRYQMLVKSRSRKALAATLLWMRELAQHEKWPATALAIDVDPLSLL